MSVAVDTTGKVGAVCALDSSLSIWNMEDYSPIGPPVSTVPSSSWGISFLPRDSTDSPLLLAMAGGSSNTVRILDVHNGKDVLSVDMPSDGDKSRENFVLSVASNQDGSRIAAGAMDGGVAIFDTKTGALVNRLKGHFKPVRSVAFMPDVS